MDFCRLPLYDNNCPFGNGLVAEMQQLCLLQGIAGEKGERGANGPPGQMVRHQSQKIR